MSKIDVGNIFDKIDEILMDEVHTIFFGMSVSLLFASYTLFHVALIAYALQVYYPFLMLVVCLFFVMLAGFVLIATIGSVNFPVHENHIHDLERVLWYNMIAMLCSLAITALCFMFGYYTYLFVFYIINSILVGVLWVGGPTALAYTYGPIVREYFDKEQ